MKSLTRFILLLCFSTLTTGNSAIGQASSDEMAIRQSLAQAYEAVNAGDADAFFTHVDPEASSFPWWGAPLDERQDPVALRNAFAEGMRFEIEASDTQVRVYGDAAVVTEYFTGTFTSASGEVTPLNLRVTGVWVKQDGRWRGVHYHQSPLVSPDED